MTSVKTPTNAIGLSKADYKGAPSTLCAGCGHDSVATAVAGKVVALASTSPPPVWMSSEADARPSRSPSCRA